MTVSHSVVFDDIFLHGEKQYSVCFFCLSNLSHYLSPHVLSPYCALALGQASSQVQVLSISMGLTTLGSHISGINHTVFVL